MEHPDVFRELGFVFPSPGAKYLARLMVGLPSTSFERGFLKKEKSGQDFFIMTNE